MSLYDLTAVLIARKQKKNINPYDLSETAKVNSKFNCKDKQ